MNKTAFKKLASRAGWTALQAALGTVTATMILESINGEEPVIIVTLVATGLSALKSFVASKVGNPETVEFK